jgi:outer membrane protein assembly factor BamB
VWTASFILLLCGWSCVGLRIDRAFKPTNDDWSTDGRSARRDRTYPSAIVPPLQEAWTADIASGVGPGSPLVVDSVVFLGTLRGEIVAFNARTGRSLGSSKIADAIPSSPTFAGQNLLVPVQGTGESVVAFNVREGRAAWRLQGDEAASSLVRAGTLVISTGRGGTICAVEPLLGEQRWSYSIGENAYRYGFTPTPACYDTTLAAACDDGTILAVNALRGSPIWKHKHERPIAGGVAISREQVVSADIDGTVFALDCSSGRSLWSISTGSPIFGVPAIFGDTVVVGTSAGMLFALDARSGGRQIWSANLGGPINAAPLRSGALLYVGTLKHRFLAVRINDGAVAWSGEVDGRIKSAPAAAYGMIYIATDAQTLYAFRSVE